MGYKEDLSTAGDMQEEDNHAVLDAHWKLMTNDLPETHGVTMLNVPTVTSDVKLNLIRRIAQKTEDSFYLLDVDDVVKKYEGWQQLMPRVKPFYAMKSNNHPILMRILATLGAGFDCATDEEIKQVEDIGVDSERIIFAHPCKQPSHVRFAIKRGVDLMTFDSEEELNKIQEIAPNARLVLRIREDSTKTTLNLGSKFGVDPTAAPHLLKVAIAMQLRVVGVCFHVGTNCREPAAYVRGIHHARAIFDEAARLGHPMTLLNIGGGFLGGSVNELQPHAKAVNAALDQLFPESEGVTVIAEPGRYMVDSAFTLATQVTSVRRRGILVDYFVNNGREGAFNGIIRVNGGPPPVRELWPSTAVRGPPATIWGPTCSSLDLIAKNVRLPPLRCGSWIFWENMGAYSLTLATRFNGFPYAAIVPVATASLSKLVRRAGLPVNQLRISSKGCTSMLQNGRSVN